jgi:large subunit ribosomal protein L10
LNRNEKEQTVAGLAAVLGKSQAVFVTDFKGLKVDEITGLRRRVGEAGGQFQVAKNTLIRLAIKGTSAESLNDHLAGPNALGTTEGDPVALAKVLVDFAKDNEKLVVKGGVLEGRSLTLDQIKSMASLPAKEVLLAQMLGAMNGVPGGFVRVLAGVPQKLLYALTAVMEQKEQPAG